MRNLRSLLPEAMLFCISTAQFTAAEGLANSARAPSPVVLINRPWQRKRLGPITSLLSCSK